MCTKKSFKRFILIGCSMLGISLMSVGTNSGGGVLLANTPVNNSINSVDNSGVCLFDNPYHRVVNKDNPLSKDFIPSNLVIPNVRLHSKGKLDKNHMELTASKELERMFSDAKKEGVTLVAVSGYRSYARQSELYSKAVRDYGYGQKGTAKQGTSGHQTGLVMDVGGVNGHLLKQSFERTPEGKWLKNNSHKYGFIIRYPKGKEKVTGIMYEPWHIRYVGSDLANHCYANNLALEEVVNCCTPEKKDLFVVESKKNILGADTFTKDSVMYIKLRDLTTLLDYSVESTSQGAKISYHNRSMTLYTGDSKIYLNGALDDLGLNTLEYDNSMYVPLRAVLSKLGYIILTNNVEDNYLELSNTNYTSKDVRGIVQKGDTTYELIRVDDGHKVYINEYGDEFTAGCSVGCIFGYTPEL